MWAVSCRGRHVEGGMWREACGQRTSMPFQTRVQHKRSSEPRAVPTRAQWLLSQQNTPNTHTPIHFTTSHAPLLPPGTTNFGLLNQRSAQPPPQPASTTPLGTPYTHAVPRTSSCIPVAATEGTCSLSTWRGGGGGAKEAEGSESQDVGRLSPHNSKRLQ